MVLSPLPPCKQRVGPVPWATVVAESPGICGSKNAHLLRDHTSAPEGHRVASEEAEENKRRKNISQGRKRFPDLK